MDWFKRGELNGSQVVNPSGASGQWTLDPWGNRLGPDGNIPVSTAAGFAGSYSGDYHGNQTLTYDAWGRLTQLSASGGAFGSLNVVFQYDALGRLVRKVKTGSGQQTSTFVNDLSGQAISQSLSGSLTRQYSYVWGMNGLVLRHRHAVGGVTAEDTYYLTDGRGDIRATTRANGQIDERFDLDPFGRLLLVETSTGGTRSYSLTSSHFSGGRYYDEYTGLYVDSGIAYNPRLNRVMQANLAAIGEGRYAENWSWYDRNAETVAMASGMALVGVAGVLTGGAATAVLGTSFWGVVGAGAIRRSGNGCQHQLSAERLVRRRPRCHVRSRQRRGFRRYHRRR